MPIHLRHQETRRSGAEHRRLGVEVQRSKQPGTLPPLNPANGPRNTRTIQPAGVEAVFAARSRVQRAPPPPRLTAEELVAQPGGSFQLRSAERNTLSPPSGTFNFVRVRGDSPRSRPTLVSAQLAHAQIASGRPVLYAGTARFERGEMAWWSNYSGTYQPIAAFRAQAGLPDDKFVPWQKLQLSGTAMQRGTFTERRAAAPAAMPERSAATGLPGAAMRPGATAARPGSARETAQSAAGRAPSASGTTNATANAKPAARAAGKPGFSGSGS